MEELTPGDGLAREVRRRHPRAEVVEVRTCHRYEVYFADAPAPADEVAELWSGAVGASRRKFRSRVRRADGTAAAYHLLRLASGLESMMVGEDQILGQVRQAYAKAREDGTVGPVLSALFDRALRTGSLVRSATKISKGAVSIGSAAVNLADELLGGLDGKGVVVIGAGEVGTLTCKALVSRRRAKVTVANRTLVKARKIARMLGIDAAGFDRIPALLVIADAVVVTTAAPQFVLRREDVERALRARGARRLLLIDLAQPRNVDEELSKVPGLILRNMDDLKGIALTNLRSRRGEVRRAERLVREEMRKLKDSMRVMEVAPVISAIYGRAEETRRRELAKAVHLLKGINDEQRKIIEDFSRELVERTLQRPIDNLRRAAEDGRDTLISAGKMLFHEAGVNDRVSAKSA